MKKLALVFALLAGLLVGCSSAPVESEPLSGPQSFEIDSESLKVSNVLPCEPFTGENKSDPTGIVKVLLPVDAGFVVEDECVREYAPSVEKLFERLLPTETWPRSVKHWTRAWVQCGGSTTDRQVVWAETLQLFSGTDFVPRWSVEGVSSLNCKGIQEASE